MPAFTAYSSKNSIIAWLLWPLSWLFRLLSALRRLAYRWHLLKTSQFAVPIVVVGNISIGGTGKTPLLIAIADALQAQGLKVGIVSRGYGGHQRHAHLVKKTDNPDQVGDEALMMACQRDYPVVIARKRVHAVQRLMTQFHCDVILSDDGLQHYAMGRRVEIVVVDGTRRFGNGMCLPAGPLREPVSRLRSVDFVVVNGGSAKAGEFSMQVQPDQLIALQSGQAVFPHELKDKQIVAMAGIGNPQRFFNSLRQLGLSFSEKVFPDHHAFSASDIDFPADIIIMTEKDAVKCRAFADARHYYLSIKVSCDQDFISQLLQKIRS